MPDREDVRIDVPDFKGYMAVLPGLDIRLDPNKVKTTAAPKRPTKRDAVEVAGPIGERKTLEPPRNRIANGAWRLAASLAELVRNDYKTDAGTRSGALFAGCLRAVREWLAHERTGIEERDLEDPTVFEKARTAVFDALDHSDANPSKVGVLRDEAHPTRSASDWKQFLTGLKTIVATERSELNVAACHSQLEGRMATKLESLSRELVVAHTRNHGPQRFEIPYRHEGTWAHYVPDFFVRCPEVNGVTPIIILEGKGMPDEKSASKGWWTDNWWIPCANALDPRYRWIRRELGPNDDVEAAIRSAIEEVA